MLVAAAMCRHPFTADALRAAALASLPKASVIAFDRDLRVLLAEGEALRDQGYDAADLVDRRLPEVLSPDRFAELAPRYAAALDGATVSYEKRSADGAHWYWVTIAPLRDESSETVGGIAISQDITSRKLVEDELGAQQHLINDVLDSLGIPVSVKDDQGRFILVNRTYEEWMDCRREELIGRANHDLYPEPFATKFTADDDRVLREGLAIEEERQTPARNGVIRTLAITRAPLRDPDGRVYGLCAAASDLTARRAVEEELRAATELFEAAFSHAPIGMGLLDLDGRWLRVNHALCELLAYEPDELTTLTFQQVTHPEDVDRDVAHVHRLLAGEIDRYTMEKRYVTRDGRQTWASLSVSLVRDESGEPLRFIAQVEDIQARHELEAQLQELADRDPLTGIWNRRRFDQELTRQVNRCRRYGERAALLILDLDRFKQINDVHGHKAGDDLLIHVCRTLSAQLRPSDSLARLGGDEFAVILPHVSAEDAERVADSILAGLMAAPLAVGSLSHQVGASVGVATLDASVKDEEEAYLAADRAMYARKRSRTPAYPLAS